MTTLDLFREVKTVGTIAQINERIRACTKCPHSKDVCTRPIGGWGASENVKLMIIGQYPGKGEDQVGRIMAKQAGEFIRDQFYKLGFSDKEIYWCNVVCCPPPEGERDIPEKQQNNCSSFLDETIDLLTPKLIVGLGNNTRRRMIAPKHMKEVKRNASSMILCRFREWDYRGYPLVLVNNPASVIRKVGFEREMYAEGMERDFAFLTKVVKDRNLR